MLFETDIIILGRPTHVYLIFWGRLVLACHADVVVSTSIAIWIFVPSPPTLRRRRIAAFEAEGCAGQRILRRKWEGDDSPEAVDEIKVPQRIRDRLSMPVGECEGWWAWTRYRRLRIFVCILSWRTCKVRVVCLIATKGPPCDLLRCQRNGSF